MSATKIGWTDLTLNPVIGCTHAAYEQSDGRKVAHPGCVNCYAEKMCSRKLPAFGSHNECSTGGQWTGKIKVLHERLAWPFTRVEYKPRKNEGRGRRCFLTSLSDMGHPGLAETDWMAVQGMMLLAPWITWQDLTKRPERQAMLLQRYAPIDCVRETLRVLAVYGLEAETVMRAVNGRAVLDYYGKQWSDFRYIHRYVSVSDQATANALIPELLKMPCAVRGVSLEPMIERVDLSAWLGEYYCPTCKRCFNDFDAYRCTNCGDEGGECDCMENEDGVDEKVCPQCDRDGSQQGLDTREAWASDMDWDGRIDHVIVGGESGRGDGIRPFALEWALDVIEQCKRAGVWCFVKQMGSKPMTTTGLCYHCKQTWDSSHEGHIFTVDKLNRLAITGKGDNPLEWPELLRVQQNVVDV